MYSCPHRSEPSRVVMLVGLVGEGSERLKSMPRKECCMAFKLVWRLVSTVSKEGPEVYRMVSSA